MVSFVCVIAILLAVLSCGYRASIMFDVWKLESESLVKAIEADSRFAGVSIQYKPASYRVDVAFSARSKVEAIDKIKEVRAFAEAWGKEADHQIDFYSDDPKNSGSYIRTTENAVKSDADIICKRSWEYLIH